MNELTPKPWYTDGQKYIVGGPNHITIAERKNGSIADIELMATAPKLYTDLKSLFNLIETGILVRETKHDNNYQSFLHQGIQITKILANCHKTLTQAEGKK